MKHKVILFVSVLAVAGGVYAAVHMHHNYVHQQTVQAAHTAIVQAQEASKQKADAATQQKQLEEAIAKLEANCQRNYDNMAAYAKQHIPVSGCTLQ